jgi:class 3 adenylate cyclase
VIYGIIEDYRGHLWLSTNNGIADFDPESGSVRVYDQGDGLPSNEYRFGAYHKGEDGTMYFGGINGMVVFRPDSIRDNPYVPPVVITDFQIFNKDVPISAINSPLRKSITETEEITLTWREEVFSFEFAALHFAAPTQNQYKYMMEGFDRSWQDVGNRRFVSYTNLPEGQKYKFHVKASNKDGIWNEEGTTIAITILPPPWKTWWAYGFYSVLGAGFLIGFINFQIGKERKKKEQIQQQNEELEALVKERTILLENEKEKSDSLLYNMLPKEIAEEIKEKGAATPRRFEEVSVLFTDFENFTTTASTMSAGKLVSELNDIFEAFDHIMGKYNLEKIKTIGDAYMAVSGLPKENPDHAVACVMAAREMQGYIQERNERSAVKWKMRIGIHSGSIIAGVVGKKKFNYDIWGSTVILASRLEEVGEPEKINISATTCDQVSEYFECSYRGKVDVQGQGEVDMYFVDAPKEALKNKFPD